LRNINELIGIIKGINFDGIINEKEVERLQSWVDKNRNLAYEPHQAELIKMVDSVLEDHIIENDERDYMIESTEEFLRSNNDDSSKIYELNGIIEGIVCDGRVNEAEVYRLKEWMDVYGNNIKGHKPSEELFEAINDILVDGIVTKEEQDSLLNMLSERISNSQFETKLDYLCKQVKDRKNIGTDLIDILDNGLAMKEIHKMAEAQLMKALSSGSSIIVNQEIIVISLVLIAMLDYDGNYYGSVRLTYTDAYDKYSEQKVEGLIRSILSRYKKQTDSGSRSRIINVALENAIVPQTFLSAFFEFIYDIYKLNFEYDMPVEPYEDFKFVFDGLRSNMLSDGDDISINVTRKTYKLIASTKQLIAYEDGLDALIKLSIIIVKLIDKRFWENEVKIFNPYLKKGFEGWEKTLKETSKGRCNQKRSISDVRSRWESRFAVQDNTVFLIPPAHRVKSQYDYRNIAVVVSNDGEEIYRNDECDIREIIGGYQINTEKIILEKPLGKLTYRVVAGDEIIYDSKDKLYRNCIVFNEEGQEISNNTDFEGTVYICYKKDEAKIKNIIIREFYCLGYMLVRVGDAIEIGHDIFNFSTMAKPGIFGQVYPHCKIKHIGEETSMQVYKGDCVLVFEADNLSSKFDISINGKPYKLSEFNYKVTQKASSSKYVVELEFDNSGIYLVEVSQFIGGSKNRIFSEEFGYDLDLNYSKDAMDDYTCRIRVTSGIISESIDTEITIDGFDPEFIRFEYNGEYYNYLIPFDFGFYKISGCDWRALEEDIWIDDIDAGDVLSIYDAECNGLLVYTESGALVEDDIELHDNGYCKWVRVSFLNSYKNGNAFVTLVFTVDGKAKYAIPCYNKTVMDKEKTEILCLDNPKQILITPYFHGRNKVFCELFNTAEEKIYMSKLLSSGQTEIIEDFESFREYTIRFHEKTNVLQLRKNSLLLELSTRFYSRQDFVGHTFKIDEAYFNQYVHGEFTEKHCFFNKLFVRITDIIDLEQGTFVGKVFVKTIRGEWELDKINPVDVEICSEVVEETMDIYMTNQGDGLLFDYEKRGVLNSLDDPTAPDIFIYTINLKGE